MARRKLSLDEQMYPGMSYAQREAHKAAIEVKAHKAHRIEDARRTWQEWRATLNDYQPFYSMPPSTMRETMRRHAREYAFWRGWHVEMSNARLLRVI